MTPVTGRRERSFDSGAKNAPPLRMTNRVIVEYVAARRHQELGMTISG
jgi:hypothetical protein